MLLAKGGSSKFFASLPDLHLEFDAIGSELGHGTEQVGQEFGIELVFGFELDPQPTGTQDFGV